jgi:signal peptidase I
VSGKKSAFREYLEAILIAIVLALFIRTFVVQAFKIPSGSMIPTLLVGDHLLVNKFIYRFRMPRRGEIVVFKFPQDRETDFIKRVLALPGEEVALNEGRLYINGVQVEDKHATYVSGNSPGRERNFKPFRVPRKGDVIRLDGEHSDLYHRLVANEGNRGSTGDYEVKNDYIFMMGDNRDNSYDSRYWGPVNIEDVVGKAMILYWSFGDRFYRIRWTRIGDLIH